MSEFTVAVFSHHFVVYNYDRKGKEALLRFAVQFAEYTYIRKWNGEVERSIARIYAARTKDSLEIRFHINVFDEFIEFLERSGYPKACIETHHFPLYEPVEVDFPIREGKQPRDYQVPIIDFLDFAKVPRKTKMVELQTGKGKTASALHAIARMRRRVGIVVRAQYIKRWLQDLTGKDSTLNLSKDDVFVVQGTKQFQALIELARLGKLECKVIIFSNRTYARFLDHYENFNRDTEMYGVHPNEVWQLLGIGIRLIDEVHQDFHFNFRLDLYTHVPMTINLSATLVTTNPVVERMYNVMFQKEDKAPLPDYDSYIAVKAFLFGLHDDKKIRYTQRGRDSYSHVVFEESIMRDKQMLARYLAMVDEIIYHEYITVRQEGQRLLVFAATVEMCGIMAKHLKQKHLDLKVERYVGGDPYTNLMESDIAVSTLGSAGTAHDVPGLRVAFKTVAVDSPQANEQAKGRLRRLDHIYPGVVPVFAYLACRDIPTHMKYHRNKLDRFRGRVSSHQVIDTGMKV